MRLLQSDEQLLTEALSLVRERAAACVPEGDTVSIREALSQTRYAILDACMVLGEAEANARHAAMDRLERSVA